MKLFYWPKTRAFRALWMLEEMRVPYELVRVNIRAGAQNDSAFCRVNPMAKLPALEDGLVRVAESGAVLLYLADRYPQARLGMPLGDPARGRFLQWMFFTGSCLEPAMAERMTGAEGNTVSFGWGDLARVEHAIESALEEGQWLLGEQFTAADLLLASTLQIGFLARIIEPQGVLFDYVERAIARDGYERAATIDRLEAERLGLRPHAKAVD